MNIPQHLIPESGVSGLELLFPQSLGPELGNPLAGAVGMEQLLELQALMQREGLGLQPTRMLYDRLYAFERLAQVYASAANPALRELALTVFHRYQSGGEWIGLIH